MTRILAIFNQKGGVGKSTTAVNVGAYLALASKRTLLVDLDAQGNATTACGVHRDKLKHTTYELFIGEASVEEVLLDTAIEGLDLLPSNLDLAGVELFLATAQNREYFLKNILDPIRANYDYILIDCPPSIGLITINALVAAQSTIIPIQCEYLSLEGLNAMTQTVQMVNQSLNPKLEIGGILMTMTDFRANLSKEVALEVQHYFPDKVFSTSIPRNIRLAESPSFGKAICHYEPHSAGALAYQMLTQEIIQREGGKDDEQALRERPSGSYSNIT